MPAAAMRRRAGSPSTVGYCPCEELAGVCRLAQERFTTTHEAAFVVSRTGGGGGRLPHAAAPAFQGWYRGSVL
jgi:hypothetical protein